MISTYLKLAWRNLLKNKAFSAINIAGLTAGMACTMLILLWVYNERSWDKSQKNYDVIYHAMSNRNFNGQITTGPDLMFPLAKTAKAAFPEVQSAAVVSFGESTLFTVDEKKLNKNTITATADFFDIFSYEFVAGNAGAVKNADALILTESTAKALFGSTDIIDRQVTVNNARTAFVKAVIKDVPRNATIQFDGIIPFNPSSPEIIEAEKEWVNCGNRIFFKTQAGVNIPTLEAKILQLIKEHAPGENPTTRGSIVLHPMNKWRLYEEFKDGKNTGGRIEYVKLFTWIALIILVIACVNFMNLSTARSEKRAREVGIRKTLGSQRTQLLWQFIIESILLSVIAFLLACVIVFVTVPAFSNLLNEDLNIPFTSPLLWLFIFAIIIITGFFAGSYPAIYLSGFNPVKVLKGTFLPGKQGLMPRKVLVTFQFIVSIVLISSTLIVYKQLQYVKNRDIGYNPDNLIMVNATQDLNKSFDAFKNDLLQTGKIAAVNRTSSQVTTLLGYTSGIRWTNTPQDPNLVMGFLYSDAGFLKTLNTKIIEGRDFQQGDSNKVMFNKEAIKVMGLKPPVTGQEVTWAGRKRTIVGVMDNLVMTSPYDAAVPLMVAYEDKRPGNVNIRLTNGAGVKETLVSIEEIFKKYSIAYPFEFRFADDEFNTKFLNEELIGQLAVIFAGLAIFICCLGLFGLVASTIEKRKKEIGIRKVLGASIGNLLLLMSKEFLTLVGLAFLVAIPLAWWAMNNWLQNYAYRTNVSIGMFALVGILTLIIALITVSLNASKAALSSPVKSIRSS